MNAYLCINLSKERYYSIARKVVDKLINDQHANLIFAKEDEKFFGASDLTVDDADFIISIGGDGTLLKSGKLALEHDLPIVGINAGRAGYLCKFSIEDIMNSTSNPFENMNVSLRDVLQMEYEGNSTIAINDYIFSSRNAGQTIVAGFAAGEKKLSYHASGVIVSSATGSTAYNASASSCVLDCSLEANIITPICPCGEGKYSCVFRNDTDITVFNMRPDDPIDIYCDGVYLGELNNEARIRKHERKLKLLM